MTNEELNQLVLELKRRIEALEQWKKEKEAQQLKNPVDYPTQQLIKKIVA